VWRSRTPAPAAHAPPAPEHRSLTLRSGRATLVADDVQLDHRSWRRRVVLPWSQVHGLEWRLEGRGHKRGQIVAITDAGAVPLRATRRPAAELHRLHGILDAYRRRAHDA
jgi:hypothetical protein